MLRLLTTLCLGTTLIASLIGCKSDSSKSPARPTQKTNDSGEADACAENAQQLALATIEERVPVDGGKLKISSISTYSLDYNETKFGKLTLTWINFEWSDAASYSRWRACSVKDKNECYPKEGWFYSTDKLEIAPTLANTELQVEAQACTDFPKDAEKACGDTQRDFVTPENNIPDGLKKDFVNIVNSQTVLRSNAYKVIEASQRFLTETKGFYQSVPNDAKKQEEHHKTYLQLYTIAYNHTQVGPSELWRYFENDLVDMLPLFNEIQQNSSLQLTNDKSEESEGCPDELENFGGDSGGGGGSDLLSQILGGTGGGSSAAAATTTLDTSASAASSSESATNSGGSSTGEKSGVSSASEDDGSTSTAAAATEEKLAYSPSNTDDHIQAGEPLHSDKVEENKQAAGWVIGIGAAAVVGSAAYLIGVNYVEHKNFKKVDEINKLMDSLSGMENSEKIKGVQDKVLAKVNELPSSGSWKGYGIGFGGVEDASGNRVFATRADERFKIDEGGVKLKGGENPSKFYIQDASGTEVKKGIKGNVGAAIGAAVLGSLMVTMGAFMYSGAEQSAAYSLTGGPVKSPTESYRKVLLDEVEADVEDHLIKLEKASESIAAAGGPKI